MDVADNRQRQQDEMLALAAIFGEAAVELCDEADSTSFVLHASIDAMEVQVDVRFYLPESYPSDTPPVFEWVGARDMSASIGARPSEYMYPTRQLAFSESMSTAAAAELHRAWDEDMGRDMVVFSWITWLAEYLSDHWPRPLDPIPLPKDGKADIRGKACPGARGAGEAPDGTAEPVAQTVVGNTGGGVPGIHTGIPIEMKKSVFVGHVARVTTADEVACVHDALMQDKRIAQATHNILAYRIRLESGAISQDNDDDGETAAGKRLGHLLQLLGVENVVVIVTRWYGGTQLGPDRFKLINNAARQALDSGGFLAEKDHVPAAGKVGRRQ
ncbi:hypothetical protein LPJ61_001975 [Coemansia biformis]|uniref:RWD domain-containing protein n=1 Tax=Coemansia biformis TaxID=1286918 RepID=A0A9W7YDB5_9FUNG|nr:hypothetical protein LPJ61_001975 [Coemansia biformis]